MNKTKKVHGHSVVEEEGDRYREIADAMYKKYNCPMNNSLIRYYLLKTMQRFVVVFNKELGCKKTLTQEQILEIAKDPRFQSAISELLQYLK